MNRREKNRFVSILTVVVVGATTFVTGCGSASDEPEASENTSGTGGASSTGGSTATGGSAGAGAMTTGGSAGAGNGTGGTSPWAGAGSGIGRPCTAEITEVAPSDGLITTFTGEDGIPIGLTALPLGRGAAPTFSTEDGALRIAIAMEPTSMQQWPNVILAFGSVDHGACVDASAFSGVRFSLRGSLSGCTLQYSTADAAHQDADTGAPIATGASGSYQPQATIMTSQLTSEPQVLTMPFVGADAPTGGRPMTPVDPAQLVFLLWQFSISPTAGGETPPCVGDITIDDVEFY